MKTNKTEIIFTVGDGECDYCGLSSFSHIHPPNTWPKDFEVKTHFPKKMSKMNDPIGTATRDLTSVECRTKSRTRQILKDFAEQVRRETIKEVVGSVEDFIINELWDTAKMFHDKNNRLKIIVTKEHLGKKEILEKLQRWKSNQLKNG